ncbi:MAG: hypothetical protein LBH74_09280 [Nitrososphaerota archaeon]|jgi:hypothetical protein|uniref:hypothetical protein n=1 Tax=Candidatus Bathycorpusculum sp. TaxID=2994959 RepID=UPI0028216982|nr:hypothetical protein [Candidatus Termitimicrobium sp.]MCL2431323.1 hypothetical protein [Candidatus Termitimicrobium sp.]MDR0493810.1 hypothetical protein [Nitrososphaerota archaeon]
MVLKQKELVNELKIEWKRLWQERVDDKIRAEGIACDDYSSLFIDKGTIIHATRDFKALNFKDILQQHEISDPERYIPPDPQVGGWNKFVRDNITKLETKNEKFVEYYSNPIHREKQPQKKNRRGWLHI